jgi:hypothetical protein
VNEIPTFTRHQLPDADTLAAILRDAGREINFDGRWYHTHFSEEGTTYDVSFTREPDRSEEYMLADANEWAAGLGLFHIIEPDLAGWYHAGEILPPLKSKAIVWNEGGGEYAYLMRSLTTGAPEWASLSGTWPVSDYPYWRYALPKPAALEDR